MENTAPLWLNPRWLKSLLSETSTPSRPEVESILDKALTMEDLTVEEAASLMRVKDPELKKLIRETARKVKMKAYGDRIIITAPLHLTNVCSSECTYCPSRVNNKAIERKRLSMDEIREATTKLVQQGHKRMVLAVSHVTAEDIDYIHDAVETVTSVNDGGEIRSVNLKVEGLDAEDFRRLKEIWDVNVVISFQETYDEECYRATHLSGPKSDFFAHLNVPDAIFEAEMKDCGFGLLLGLSDWRFDVLALIQHSEHLIDKYGTFPHTVNLSRLCRVPGSLLWPAPHALSDEEYLDCIAMVRLAIPNTGIIVSTREPGDLWKQACEAGASQLYTGSLANPYESWTEAPNQQVPFPDQSESHLDEIVRYFVETARHLPAFCAACGRMGRTGHDFMEMVRNCGMSSQCWPNACASLYEYLLHYATPRTREMGEQLIQTKLGEMSSSEREIAERLMGFVRNGRLDEFV